MKLVKLLSVCALSIMFSACSSTKDAGCSVSQPANTPGSPEDFKSCVKDRVFFDFDRSDISTSAMETVKSQAKWLTMYGCPKVVISGHTDKRGTRDYNLSLGERRANALKMALVNEGVKADRIHVVSYGKEKTVVEGNNERAYAENRVSITAVGGEK